MTIAPGLLSDVRVIRLERAAIASFINWKRQVLVRIINSWFAINHRGLSLQPIRISARGDLPIKSGAREREREMRKKKKSWGKDRPIATHWSNLCHAFSFSFFSPFQQYKRIKIAVFCLDSVIYEHGSRSAVPAYGLQSRIGGEEPRSHPAITWSYIEDDIPTFGRLQQKYEPHHHRTPPPHHTPPPPLPPSLNSLLLPPPSMYLHICKHWARFYSHLPKRIRAEGRAPTVRAVRLSLSACRAEWWQKKRKKKKKGQGGREKSLFSDNTILAECLPVSDKRGKEKKKYSPSVNSGKSVLSLRLNAWVPPAFSVLAIPPLHPRLQRGTCKHIS